MSTRGDTHNISNAIMLVHWGDPVILWRIASFGKDAHGKDDRSVDISHKDMILLARYILEEYGDEVDGRPVAGISDGVEK